MKTKAGTLSFDDLPTEFLELVAYRAPHPIADDVDLDNVMEVVNCLAGQDLTQGQNQYLDLISELVEKYEAEHHAINTSGMRGLEALKYLVDLHKMSAADLGRLLGDRSLGTRTLSGERELSKAHIRALADHFKVNPSLFF